MHHLQETADYRIAHLFADFGVEAEVLSSLGSVVRYTIDPRENEFVEKTVSIDLMEEMPAEDGFDLALLHPRCTDKSDMTSISGDSADHESQISRAREIATTIADDYIIENKPRDELEQPVILNGSMFGLPINYERAFECSFSVSSPPRERQIGEKTVSPYFYTDRSVGWWKMVKGYTGSYAKRHLSKNAVPAVYIQTILRSWLEQDGKNSEEVQDNNNHNYRDPDESQRKLSDI